MSEFNLLVILAAPFVSIARAGTRRRTMLREINHELAQMKDNGLEFDRDSKMMVISKSSRLQSGIPPLLLPQSIGLQQRHNPSVLDKAAKIIATVKALKGKQELQDLSIEIDKGMPNINRIIEEASHLISTRNVSGLNMRASEIDRSYERMLTILRAKDKELVRTEISATASNLKLALQEIGFGSVKEISSEGGAILLRAKSPDSHASVVAKVNASDIRIDTHGFIGPACSKTVTALLNKLREKGIDARVQERVFHNRAEGGELVKETTSLFDPLDTTAKDRTNQEKERNRRLRMERNRQKARS